MVREIKWVELAGSLLFPTRVFLSDKKQHFTFQLLKKLSHFHLFANINQQK